jgi:hypothetical protein
MYVGQSIRNTDRDALPEDGSKQSFPTQWHAAKQRRLLLSNPHDGCQVKQVALGRHEWLTLVIHGSQGEGGKGCASQFAGRFCNQMQQSILIQFTHERRAHPTHGCDALSCRERFLLFKV